MAFVGPLGAADVGFAFPFQFLQPAAEGRSPVLPLRFQVGLCNSLRGMWWRPTRQRDRRSPRQATVPAPLATAEDALARLDERLRTSPIREGFIARTHFLDACASLWLEGELVHLEDLELHDAQKDVRTPTHELTRAHAVLRARRRIASAEHGWALSTSGRDGLRGRAGEGEDADPA